MKLIKINEEHYVVVDETEIKEGDYVINIQRNHIYPTPVQVIDVEYRNRRNDVFKKITHSTKVAIEDYWNIIELPLSEIKELIGEVDVEKKAREEILYNEQKREWWKQGYNQALEDSKEKKYTEEDVRKACRLFGIGKTLDSCIKSIQPKTEWEVEFINGKLTIL